MFVAVLYPYVYLLARTAFLERPASLVEAARTMGLDARRAFWRIDLPLARPAVAGGIALALMETLADYGTVAYFAVDTFTTGIYRAWFSLGDRVAAAQLSAALLAFVIGAVLLERWSAARRESRRQPPTKPQGAAASVAGRLAGVDGHRDLRAPILIGFALPVVLLARLALSEPGLPVRRGSRNSREQLPRIRLTAVLAVVFAITVAYAVRLAPGALTRERAGCWGSAMPCRARCLPWACCFRSAPRTSGSLNSCSSISPCAPAFCSPARSSR